MPVGRYDDEIVYTNGRPAVGASVLIQTTDGDPADLFTDEDGLTAAANPISYAPATAGETGLDTRGNLVFHADVDTPGPYYDIVVTPAGGAAFAPYRVRVAGGTSGGGGGGDHPDSDHTSFATSAALATEVTNRTSADTAHAAALDPHPGYLTPAEATAAFDAIGAASAAQAAAIAASQPLDSDLTAIAALSTTSYGRAFLGLADAAAARTALALGTAATQATGAFEAAGAATAAQSAAVQRANHTGTQLASTVSDFTEAAQDAIGALLADSATLDVTYNDAGNAESAAVLDSPKVGGVSVTGTPTSGQVPTATSGTAASWQTPSGGASSETPWEILILPGLQKPFATANDVWSPSGNDAIYPNVQLVSQNASINGLIQYKVLLGAGTWKLRVLIGTDVNDGIHNFSLDGVLVGTADGYAASAAHNLETEITGIVVATTGVKTFEDKMATKNASSGFYRGRISVIQFQRTA